MRLALALLLTLVVCASALADASPPASNGDVASVEAVASLGKKSAVLDLNAQYSNPSGARPRDPQTMVIRFPRGATWNGTKFPKCSYARLPYCPKSTLIATGSALADARPAISDPFPADVKIYNAQTKKGKPTLAVYGKSEAGPEARFEMFFSFPKKGAYGTVLTFPVMKAFGKTPLFTITSFKIKTLDKSYRGTPLISAKSCPGAYGFSFEQTFPGGERLVAKDTLPCPSVGRR
jgi:hypothetical protein